MKMRHLPALLACFLGNVAQAQTPSAEVRKFIKVEAPLLALAHVRVIDGTGAAALEDRTVLVRGGRIDAVLDAAAPLPAGAQVLDLHGRTVLPGLVGMHNHLMYTASINLDEDDKIPPPGFFVTEIAFSAPRMYLAAGVTMRSAARNAGSASASQARASCSASSRAASLSSARSASTLAISGCSTSRRPNAVRCRA